MADNAFYTAFNSVFNQLIGEIIPRMEQGQRLYIDTDRLQELVRQRITPGTASAPGVAMVLDAEFRACVIDLSVANANAPAQSSGLNEIVPAGTMTVVLPSDGSPTGKKFPEGVQLTQKDPQTAKRGAKNRVFSYDVKLAKQLSPFF